MRYLLMLASLLLTAGCHYGVSASKKFVPLATATVAQKALPPVIVAMGTDSGLVAVGTKPAAAKRVYAREEFKTLITGKTQDEVIKLIGKPDRTGETAGNIHWRYEGITKDPSAKNVDDSVDVHFRDGVVDHLVF